ncbi:MAG: S53 family peptidase [Acidimicrobiales bacterium]
MASVPLAGSERSAPAGAEAIGAPDPAETMVVTVVLRPANDGAAEVAELGRTSLSERRYLSEDELGQLTGAPPDQVAAVEAFAATAGLQVLEVSPASRKVVVSGTAAAMSSAFGVQLRRYRRAGQDWRGHEGPVQVPAELAGVLEAVVGLDERPQARTSWRATESPSSSYTPVELAQLYDYPVGLDGTGQSIGIIELGGGYQMADLDAYFASLGRTPPRITAVSVDGASNEPTGSPSGPDTEVDLDIEVSAGVAPGAAIVVYFAPNTDRGFIDAASTAVHDATNSPSVLSISWGSAESTWTPASMRALDQVLADASLVGITVTVACGDSGSADGVLDGLAHVDFPASSPHVLACGGTRLLEGAPGEIATEVVWNDGDSGGSTGGGVSDVFALPSWQERAGVPGSVNPGGRVGRGLPDVAGDADPATGYEVRVDGSDIVVGGTSAVAPLWAGLIALLNQSQHRRLGLFNPVLYLILDPATACRDVTEGTNGAYKAGPGWDACTGWGSPRGEEISSALAAPG